MEENTWKFLWLAFLLLPLVIPPMGLPPAQALSATIRGQVVDSISGAPLEEAIVTVWEYEVF